MTQLLIVESDKYLRDFLSRVFARSGYVVRATANEVDSLAVLSEQLPDAIVLDLFPLRTARAMLNELRHWPRTASIPVIGLVSGDQASEEQARALGCDVYIRKPFDLEDLLYQVTTVVGMPTPQDHNDQLNRRRGE